MTSTARDRFWLAVVAVGLALLLAHGLDAAFGRWFDAWNGQLLDPLLARRPRTMGGSAPVAFVELGDTDRRALARVSAVADRAAFGRVLANLQALAPVAIAVDVVFSGEGKAAEDAALVEATSREVPVYFGMAFQTDGDGAQLPTIPATADEAWIPDHSWSIESDQTLHRALPRGVRVYPSFSTLAARSRGLGVLNVESDPDGVHRWLPLLYVYEGRIYPALALRLFADHVGANPRDIRVTLGEHIVLRTQHGGSEFTIPIDNAGRIRLSFRGGWADGPFAHYAFTDLWHGFSTRDDLEQWREELQGRFVVVCDVTSGSDVGPTPVDTRMPLAALHATAIHMLLTGDYLPDVPTSVALIVELLIIGGLGVAAVRSSSLRLVVWTGVAALNLAAIVVAELYWLQQVLPPLRPAILLVSAATLILLGRYFIEERDRQVLKRSFAMYFPPAVVERIVRDPDFASLGGERREITILFSDIKDFTTMTAEASPSDIHGFMNEYFEAMVDIVFAHGGTVDKFIGDGLMALFGAPEAQLDHATRAVEAAVAMQQRLRGMRGRWRIGNRFDIQTRMGVHTGEVIVGNMGSSRRLSYTALGAPVNLAQRLESLAKPGGILVSARCHALLSPHIRTAARGPMPVKGFSEPVEVFEIVDP